MKTPHGYEEHKLLPQAVGWLLLILLSACLIGYALWVHTLIPDVPRRWDFGAVPQTPADSIYSTRHVGERQDQPQQVAPLPEARPLKTDPQRGGEQP